MARISLNLVAEQHDLIYHVLAEIQALLKQNDIRDVANRNRLFTRLHLLCDFLVEHFFIERESFMLPLRRMVRRRKNSERLLRGLRKLEREIDQLRQFAEAFSVRYANPHRKDAGSDQALEDIEIFVERVEELIRKEDRLLIPLAERVSGRKSRRLNLDQAMLALAEEAAQRVDEENGSGEDGEYDEGDGMTDGLVDSTADEELDALDPKAARAMRELERASAAETMDASAAGSADADETVGLDDVPAGTATAGESEDSQSPYEGNISDELEVEYEVDEEDVELEATVRAVEGAPLVTPIDSDSSSPVPAAAAAPAPVEERPVRRSLDPDETMAASDLHVGEPGADSDAESNGAAASDPVKYDTGAEDDSLIEDDFADDSGADADETMDGDEVLTEEAAEANGNGATPGSPRRPRRRRRGGASGRRRISRRRTARR